VLVRNLPQAGHVAVIAGVEVGYVRFHPGIGYADDLNLRMHAVKRNRFVLEGGHFDFETITSILKAYRIEELKDNIILIGLVQKRKTVDEYFNDLRKYDTKDEWTYDMDDELREFSEMSVAWNREMTDYLLKYGFAIYDTSTEREQVLNRIIDDIKLRVT